MAEIPEDEFEALLAAGHRSTRFFVNYAKGLPANHRRGSRLSEAVRAAQCLTSAELDTLLSIIVDSRRHSRDEKGAP